MFNAKKKQSIQCAVYYYILRYCIFKYEFKFSTFPMSKSFIFPIPKKVSFCQIFPVLCSDHQSLCQPGMLPISLSNRQLLLLFFFFFFETHLKLLRSDSSTSLTISAPPPLPWSWALTFWGPQHGILPPQYLLHSLINVTSPNCDLAGWRQEFGVGVIFISGSPVPTPIPKIVCFHTCLFNDKTNDWLMKTQITGWERKDKNALK